MAFSLFACGGGGDNTESPNTSPVDTSSPDDAPPADTGSPETTPSATPPTQEQLGTDSLDQVGFYDPNYDYNANPRYKFIYVCIGYSDLNRDFNDAFANWAKLANVDYGGYFSAASNEELLTQLPTFKEQGYDGVILDPDMTQFEQIAEICDRIGLPWMGNMGQAFKFDAAGMPAGLIHPFVGFSGFEFGRLLADRLIEYANDNWPGVTLDQIGFIGVDMSTSPPLHERVQGSQAAWEAAGGPVDNFIVADVGFDMTIQAAQNVVESNIALNPELEYWLINGVIEDFADGAANAIDNVFGNPDNACIGTVRGAKLAAKWDEGITSAWRYVIDVPTPLVCEPVFFALYAFVSGQATPETIWPSWIDHNPANVPYYGETYAYLMLPHNFQDQSNYKQMLTWANMYAHSDIYPYNEPGVTLDDFASRAAIPESYKG
jgi:hypothetical protein